MRPGVLFCFLFLLTLKAYSQRLIGLERNQGIDNKWVPTTPDSLLLLANYQISTRGDTLDLEKKELYSPILNKKSALYRYVRRDDKPISLRYGEYKAILRRLAQLEKERF